MYRISVAFCGEWLVMETVSNFPQAYGALARIQSTSSSLVDGWKIEAVEAEAKPEINRRSEYPGRRLSDWDLDKARHDRRTGKHDRRRS